MHYLKTTTPTPPLIIIIIIIIILQKRSFCNTEVTSADFVGKKTSLPREMMSTERSDGLTDQHVGDDWRRVSAGSKA